MSHLKPSLELYRPVLNIGQAEVNVLKQELVDDIGDDLPVTPRMVNFLFTPLVRPRAEVLIHIELLRLHESIRYGEVSEEHIDDLSNYLTEALPAFSEGITDTPTLPVRRFPLGEGAVLTVAGNSTEVMQERVFVKAALANYYRLHRIPTHPWMQDEGVTNVWLARSEDESSNDLLIRLESLLERKPGLLPDRIEMGALFPVPHPPRAEASANDASTS